MFKIAFDAARLIKRFHDIEKKELSDIMVKSINDTAFDIRDGFKDEFRRVFDRPRPLTVNSILFKAATPGKLSAEVFVRNEVNKGVPPSEYLFPNVQGGGREQKVPEKRLQANPRIRNKFFTPGRSMPLDAYGNLPAKFITKIMSQLAVQFDPTANETEKKRGSRLRRQRKKGGGGSFFVLPVKRGKLRPGVVYERVVSGSDSIIRTALFPVNSVNYSVRFKPGPVAQKIFDRKFKVNFERRMRAGGRLK